MPKQILLVHGGMTFKNKEDHLDYLRNKEISLEGYISWSGEYLEKNLGPEYVVFRPRFPCADYAQYEEWKIIFEKYFDLLDDECILIGNSLGGIFLAKYFSENKPNKKIKALYLVCAPFDNTLEGEDLVGGFELQENISALDSAAETVRMFFSEDDDVVPVAHAQKYQEKLAKTSIHIYDDKCGHFCVADFPELIEFIRADCT